VFPFSKQKKTNIGVILSKEGCPKLRDYGDGIIQDGRRFFFPYHLRQDSQLLGVNRDSRLEIKFDSVEDVTVS
jgi:hypothetical protein